MAGKILHNASNHYRYDLGGIISKKMIWEVALIRKAGHQIAKWTTELTTTKHSESDARRSDSTIFFSQHKRQSLPIHWSLFLSKILIYQPQKITNMTRNEEILSECLRRGLRQDVAALPWCIQTTRALSVPVLRPQVSCTPTSSD
jgi:hypothetical protein